MNCPNVGNAIASNRESLRQTARGLAAPGEDADEVQSSFDRHLDQLHPRSDLGMSLVLRIFVLMLRLRRFVENEARALTAKGVAYDDSPEAMQARKAEAATSRELFRTTKEFRLVEAAFAPDGERDLDAIPVDLTPCDELGSFRTASVEADREPSIETLASFCPEAIQVVEPPSVAMETGIEVPSTFLGTTATESVPEVVSPPSVPVAVPYLPEVPPRISFLDPRDPPRSVGWNGYQQF